MKKITTLLLMLALAVAAHAQFQQGKAYLGASLTGVELNYTGKNGLNLGIEGKAGYLLEDNWMVLAQASLEAHRVERRGQFLHGGHRRPLLHRPERSLPG